MRVLQSYRQNFASELLKVTEDLLCHVFSLAHPDFFVIDHQFVTVDLAVSGAYEQVPVWLQV